MARILCIQHVAFETPGYLATWAEECGHRFETLPVWKSDAYPPIEDVDLLVLLGGPMSVHDTGRHRWLEAEKSYLVRAVRRDWRIVGICLGAQLIAEAAGAQVRPAPQPEYGWGDVTLTSEAIGDLVFSRLPAKHKAFHWHGENFDLPTNAVPLASTATNRNQAFRLGNRVYALQYHLEFEEPNVIAILENAGADLLRAEKAEEADKILSQCYANIVPMRKHCKVMLDAILEL